MTAFDLRTERPDDGTAVAAVVRAAVVRQPDAVALLVEKLRASAYAVPELGLVAEDASGVIGHVVLSHVEIEGGARARLLVLSALRVRARERARVGCALPSIPDEAFMVKRLPGWTPALAGQVVHPAAFDDL